MFDIKEADKRIKEFNKDSLGFHLGIEFTKFEESMLTARMPVDHRTRQPFGILHGGASVALAETLGSVASFLVIPPDYAAVGLEINANHLRPVKSGWVYGTVKPIHVGRKTHVWDIEITNEEGKKVCVSRLTCMIIKA